MKEKKTYIYGRHALIEALSHAPKTIKKVFLASSMQDEVLLDLIKEVGVSVSELSENAGGKETRDASHQGVVALVDSQSLTLSYDEFMNALTIKNNTALVIMGELQDPQNIGAVIRSAVAFGASGVLIPKHNQGQVTGAVVKVSAGMVFKIPLVSIDGLEETISDLKKRGVTVYGLAGGGNRSIVDEQFTTPTAFVLGNESKGISSEVHDMCDVILSIPIDTKCESLNVAVSASIVLYDWKSKHQDITE